MTARVPRGLFTATHDCGFTRTATTQALADKSLRAHSCAHQKKLQARAARVAARKADTGIRRDCQCKEASHTHGTINAYKVDRCRCRPCRDANNVAHAVVSRQQAYGTYDSGRSDIHPVIEHIINLRNTGIGLRRLAELTGLSRSTLTAIVNGRTERGQTYKTVTRRTAELILAVKPGLDAIADKHPVDATGTRRRLQALVAIGWSQSRLGERIGVSAANMGPLMRAKQVSARRAKDVCAIYDELWDKPQNGSDHRTRISAARARRHAARNGWYPPLAWDDDTIDDPEAVPAGLEKQSLVRKEERIDDVAFLLEAGCGKAEVLKRSGFSTYEAFEKFCYNFNRADLIARYKAIGRRSAA